MSELRLSGIKESRKFRNKWGMASVRAGFGPLFFDGIGQADILDADALGIPPVEPLMP
jgi:hypothetical protein